MTRTDWTVGDEGIRPAGKPDQCFYCQQPRGGQHKPDCAIRGRTVVCRITLDFVRVVPEDWDQQAIEFQMNDGSGCSNNFIDDVNKLIERIGPPRAIQIEGCLCGRLTGQYIREATADDENLDKLFIADQKS